MSKKIPLTQGKFAIVDDEDYEWLSQWKWFAFKSCRTFYAGRQESRAGGKQITIRMHREIMKAAKGVIVDHRNHQGLDNKRINLRSATKSENNQNELPIRGGTSHFKGVYHLKNSKKWRAKIQSNKKQIHLGYFNSELEAARAYDKTALKLFGEFACTNFQKEKIA